MKATKLTNRVYVDTSGEGKGNIGAIELNNYTIVVVDAYITQPTYDYIRIMIWKIPEP
ncbi:MAG: hypothetical protein NWE87_01995 [Candidatus Bathyarchaeota archaeon]|nr:hypothetical protein [Candidatus Bathyarchaeota archaeon]